MPHIADKPFLDTLAEDVRIDPAQGVLGNIGHNVARTVDTMAARDMYRTRARQLNQALAEWQRRQPAFRPAARPTPPPQQPAYWPKYPSFGS